MQIQTKQGEKIMTTNFYEAFKDRYLDTGDVDFGELTIKQKYTKDLVVELVGRERAIDTFKNLLNLKQIVLNNCSIRNLIDEDEQNDEQNEGLRENLKSNQNITSLDISYNQIENWIEIVRIVELFPFIEELIISNNQFKSIKLDNLDWQIKVLSKIKHLIAGKLRISWSLIELFSRLFINLKSLNIFNNNLIELKLNDKTSFLNLEYLSLSENQITWSNALNLNQLQNLKHLQLDNCRINEIVLNDSSCFNSIKQLNLSNNQLAKWSDIFELSKLNNLIDLSVRENPLFKEQDYDLIFNFTVAILKNLKVLNKQIVS